MKRLLIMVCLVGMNVSPLQSCDLRYNDSGIVEDDIARAIKHPRPPSVTNLLTKLDSVSNKEKVRSLDVSYNYIMLKGATQILQYVQANFPNLRNLNFQGNRISPLTWDDSWESSLSQEFETILISFLNDSKDHSIDISHNYFDPDCIQQLNDKLRWGNLLWNNV